MESNPRANIINKNKENMINIAKINVEDDVAFRDGPHRWRLFTDIAQFIFGDLRGLNSGIDQQVSFNFVV